MGTFTSVTTVSARYYEKRNRHVAEANIRSMCRTLGRPEPQGLGKLPKGDLVNMALRLHSEMPE